MTWTVLIIFLAAALAVPLHRLMGEKSAWLLLIAPVGSFIFYLAQLPHDPANVMDQAWVWAALLNVTLSFRLDGLALLFALLVTGIGSLIVIYARGYMHGQDRYGLFMAYLLFFMGSMLGVVTCDSVIGLFVFWELTSISSFLLIGFNHTKPESREAALQALLVTGSGGLALLGGLILMMIAAVDQGMSWTQASTISNLIEAVSDGRIDLIGAPLYPAMLILILLGCFTKSAQVPFHFWLPSAMAAPTPVSAFLHSATMVKAGVFLLARLQPALGAGEVGLWHYIVTPVGALTLLVAAVMAIGHRDLKKILAYSTVAVLGTCVMLIGGATDYALKAAVVFITAHAMYKAALFMVAGSIDHETGTRDIMHLGGLRKLMPITFAAAAMAALSKAGAPPLFGFIGKELMLKAKLEMESMMSWLIIVAVVANILLTAATLMVAVWPFFGKEKDTPKHAHEAPWTMWLGPLLLALLGVTFGLFPGLYEVPLGSAAASSVIGHGTELHLKLWHGVEPVALTALGLSAMILLLGAGMYLVVRRHLQKIVDTLARLSRFGPTVIYERWYWGQLKFAGFVIRHVQSGRLRAYIWIIFTFTVLAVARPLWFEWQDQSIMDLPMRGAFHEYLLALLIVVGALLAIMTRQKLVAVACLGLTGMSIAILFVMYGAPDLAITQIMVETLTVIMFVYVFYHLPEIPIRRTWMQRSKDIVLACAVGILMTALTLMTALIYQPTAVSNYYRTTAVPEAHGRNIVNVILVDYRAIDTLGEITVVAVAGIGVAAMVHIGRQHKRRKAADTQTQENGQ